MWMQIITPLGVAFSKQVDEIRTQGVLGEFGILPGHRPFVTPTVSGRLLWKSEKEQGSFEVTDGFCEIDAEGTVFVLVQTASPI